MKVADQIKAIANRPGHYLTINQLRVVVALERAVARLENSPTLRDHLIFKEGHSFVLIFEAQNSPLP